MFTKVVHIVCLSFSLSVWFCKVFVLSWPKFNTLSDARQVNLCHLALLFKMMYNFLNVLALCVTCFCYLNVWFLLQG